MTIWFRDHVLPGLIVAALVGASHAHLWRRMKKLTEAQTREIKGDSEEKGAARD